MTQIDASLAEFDRIRNEHPHPGDAWVIDYGRTCLSAARDYIHAHRGKLIALARPDRADAAAAE